MSHLPRVFDLFSRLLCYPDNHTPQAAELLFVVLQDELPAAASDLSQFGQFLETNDGRQLEEAFTGTFDVNPTCALEVGWHLFGEEYARGMFLVRMREELRRYGKVESQELPDHICHVLAVVAAMPDDKATSFVRACVQPAVAIMNEGLANKTTPYRHVIDSLLKVLEAKWGTGATPALGGVLEARSTQCDPLHAFPVAAVDCGQGCHDACGQPDVVELQPHFRAARPDATSAATTSESGS